jgi:MazG family protein
MNAIDELMHVVASLRNPKTGCAWDRAQTPSSMTRFILEEAYELVEAIDTKGDEDVVEEIGDLLFTIVLLCQMGAETGRFSLTDAANAAARKMIRRHPHVFGDAAPPAPGSWERMKREGEIATSSLLDSVPADLPALLRAERLGHKASTIRFDWPDASGPRAKIDEELAELDAAMRSEDPSAITHEIGDVLMSVASLARHVPGPGAEAALRQANARFSHRFQWVEEQLRMSGRPADEVPLEQLERWWQDAKQKESL